MRQGCPLSQLLFKIVLEFLDRAIRQEEEIKGIQIGKVAVKMSLFADNKILYLKDPKNSTPKTSKYHKQLQQCSRIQNQPIKLSSLSIYQQIEKEYKKTIPFTIVSKKFKYLGVNLMKDINDLFKEN
jgi:hypothetical protein